MVLLDWMLSPLISKESKAMKRLLSAITCLTLLCSACSSGPHTGEPQGDPTAGKDLNYSKFSDVKATFDNEHMEIILPLNKYMMSTPEGLITLSANIYNNNDCVVKNGNPSGHVGDGVEIKPDFQYGIWNKDYVSKYGYSIDHDVTKIRIATMLPEGKNTDSRMEAYTPAKIVFASWAISPLECPKPTPSLLRLILKQTPHGCAMKTSKNGTENGNNASKIRYFYSQRLLLGTRSSRR